MVREFCLLSSAFHSAVVRVFQCVVMRVTFRHGACVVMCKCVFLMCCTAFSRLCSYRVVMCLLSRLLACFFSFDALVFVVRNFIFLFFSHAFGVLTFLVLLSCFFVFSV